MFHSMFLSSYCGNFDGSPKLNLLSSGRISVGALHKCVHDGIHNECRKAVLLVH